jgi:hypothetical protein
VKLDEVLIIEERNADLVLLSIDEDAIDGHWLG